MWNTADGKKIATSWVERHLHGSRAISADGTKIALEEPDHAIMILDATTGELISRIPGTTRYYKLAFSKQGDTLFTSSQDGITAIWSVQNGSLITQLKGHTNAVIVGEFNNKGTAVLTISWDRTARLWNTQTGVCLAVIRNCNYAHFSPQSTFIVACHYEILTIWRTRTCRYVVSTINAQVPIISYDISPSSNQIKTYLLFMNGGPRSMVWNLDGTPVKIEESCIPFNQISFSPRGDKIAAVGANNTIRILNADDTQKFITLAGHTDRLVDITWNKRQNTIVTVDNSGNLRIWDAPLVHVKLF